ncbi:hypothetical protein BsWGS_03134 [Bradybaena similaris]
MADERTTDSFSVIKDGIKYQILKEDSKRTSFASTNQQITFKGRQVIQGIEKSEKLMSSDFRRQQTMLMEKLEKLQKKKETLGLVSKSRNLTERRHSEPIDRDLRTHSSLLHFRFQKSVTSRPDSGGSDNNEDNAQHGSSKPQRSPTSQQAKLQKSRENLTNPRINDARRQSQEIQKEILATSLPKLEAIMASGRRRATISDSASLADYFPSSMELRRLSHLWGKASSVDEENG